MNGNERDSSAPKKRTGRVGRSIRSEEGFTFIGALLAVAIIGTQMGVTGLVWSFVQERQKEKELLFVGDQFRTAIGRFYLNPKGPQKEFPRKLADLIRDPRYPGAVRHLRKIYADPITGQVRWKLITTPDCRIIGVHSLSEKAPIKIGGFRPAEISFEKKQSYTDWKFVYTVGLPFGLPRGGAAAGTAAPNPPALPNASSISACPKIYTPEGTVQEEGNTAQSFTGSGLFSGQSSTVADPNVQAPDKNGNILPQ